MTWKCGEAGLCLCLEWSESLIPQASIPFSDYSNIHVIWISMVLGTVPDTSDRRMRTPFPSWHLPTREIIPMIHSQVLLVLSICDSMLLCSTKAKPLTSLFFYFYFHRHNFIFKYFYARLCWIWRFIDRKGWLYMLQKKSSNYYMLIPVNVPAGRCYPDVSSVQSIQQLYFYL